MTDEEKQKLIDAGYSVRGSVPFFWALNPENHSIVRGPAATEEIAWEICKRDFDNRQDA